MKQSRQLGTVKWLNVRSVEKRTDRKFIPVIGSGLAQTYIGMGAKMVGELFYTGNGNKSPWEAVLLAAVSSARSFSYRIRS